MSGFGKVMPTAYGNYFPRWSWNSTAVSTSNVVYTANQTSQTTGNWAYYPRYDSQTLTYEPIAIQARFEVAPPYPDEAEVARVGDELWASWNISVHESQVERERAERMRREREQAVALADVTAHKLLMAHLTPQQRDQYKEHRYFEVFTARNGQVRRYRLTHGWAGNVFLMRDQDTLVARYCIHPTQQVPIADNLLAQKLLLEADEEQFLKIANRTELRAA